MTCVYANNNWSVLASPGIHRREMHFSKFVIDNEMKRGNENHQCGSWIWKYIFGNWLSVLKARYTNTVFILKMHFCNFNNHIQFVLNYNCIVGKLVHDTFWKCIFAISLTILKVRYTNVPRKQWFDEIALHQISRPDFRKLIRISGNWHRGQKI